jgi:hypothetical protein
MNQTPCASIYGTRARITKPHIKTHARHKSRSPNPTSQPSPKPTIRSVSGNRNSQGSKHKHTRKKRKRKNRNKNVTREITCVASREQTSTSEASEIRKPGNRIEPEIKTSKPRRRTYMQNGDHQEKTNDPPNSTTST